MNYTNSSLVICKKLSPNNSGQRSHSIDRISPHCVVGQCTAEGLGEWFAKTSVQASSNYGIDKNGQVGMYVEEKNRSWCTSSSSNDNRAITIECASDTSSPYRMNDVVYQTLIRLCADICKRNGKSKLLWLGTKDRTLAYTPAGNEMVITVHCWFANKNCPGEWLMSRLDDLAAQVNAILDGGHPMLQKGCTGEDVKELQTDLVGLGYDVGKYGIDGDFGSDTEVAVKAFQKDHGLVVDGIVGDATWAEIDKAMSGDPPAPTPTPIPSQTYHVLEEEPIFKDAPEEVGVCPKGVYTIMETSGKYGRLKSGLGWIEMR